MFHDDLDEWFDKYFNDDEPFDFSVDPVDWHEYPWDDEEWDEFINDLDRG